MMVASLVPMVFLPLQMYSPESCRPTLGSSRLPFTSLCLQGRGDRSLDHDINGEGNPTETGSSGQSWSLKYYIHTGLGNAHSSGHFKWKVYVNVQPWLLESTLHPRCAWHSLSTMLLTLWHTKIQVCHHYLAHYNAVLHSVPPPPPWMAQELSPWVLLGPKVHPEQSLPHWSQRVH